MDGPLNKAVLSKSTGVTCKECDGIFFKQVVALRTISKFALATLSATPMDKPGNVMIPIPIHLCNQCETPLEADIDGLINMEAETGS